MPEKGFWSELAQSVGRGVRGGASAYFRSGGKASAGLSEIMSRNAQQRLVMREKQQMARNLRLGHATLRLANGQTIQRWSKYRSSTDGATGLPQTDYYEGYVGERNKRLKVHIAVDANGRLLYVRDIDGTELFDRGRGDTPPPGWE